MSQTRYVPPHLRYKSSSASSTGSPAASSSTDNNRYDSNGDADRQTGSPRQVLPGQRWTHRQQVTAMGFSGPSDPSGSSPKPIIRNSRWADDDPSSNGRDFRSTPNRAPLPFDASPSRPGAGPSRWGQAQTTPGRPAPSARDGLAGSPSLHVFGDSFVGPMKLLSEQSVRVQTYKGASAKGLNNPKSIKQVAKQLMPPLNELLAPPPYVYVPSTGRWAMLVFGNVDLQINYIWQLIHKPITEQTLRQSNSDVQGEPELNDSEPTTASDESPPASSVSDGKSILATATETTLAGPALGPDIFVDNVVKAYTTFLTREIIEGPIGQRLREADEARRAEADGTAPPTGGIRRPPRPGKVLIAAALPPLIEDEVLFRIPEKYVDRLEEEHEKLKSRMDRSKDEPATSPAEVSSGPTGEIEVGLATVSMSDDPAASHHAEPGSIDKPDGNDQDKTTEANGTKTQLNPVSELLKHDPPLCTLPVRVAMTNRFNAKMSAFCAENSAVLSFVDIAPRMHAHDAANDEPRVAGAVEGSVDRGTWACPVDPTNVHPLWEPTLPLWLEALAEAGVPTQGWQITEDAEETFRAYEEDKRRRTEKSAFGANGGQDTPGPAGEGPEARRIKLRDE